MYDLKPKKYSSREQINLLLLRAESSWEEPPEMGGFSMCKTFAHVEKWGKSEVAIFDRVGENDRAGWAKTPSLNGRKRPHIIKNI